MRAREAKRTPCPAGLRSWLLAFVLVQAAAAASAAPAQPLAEALYARHCAACHGADRLGGSGPALLPENLSRLKRPQAERVILEGRPATRMPGFAGQLSPQEVRALADYIYAPLPAVPRWGEAEIRASRIEHASRASLPERPVHGADPLNLFVVVETGDHHVTILDGDRFEPLARFPSRFALHGGPKFSPDGRFVYLASRDGWVSRYDLWGLRLVAEVRAGINTRNLAVSSDGRYVAVANYLPHTLVVLDADLYPVRVIEARAADGERTSRISAVYDAPPRKSFVAALKDVPEVWELAYSERPGAAAAGLVHEGGERAGGAVAALLRPRRIVLEEHLDDFAFTPDYSALVASSREGAGAQVVDLDARRRIATLALPGMPHLASGIAWRRNGRTLMATPNLREARVSVFEVGSWRLVREIPTPGAGFFLRSHEASRYAWVDAFNSPRRDTIALIDKETLELAHTLRPAPGKTAAHVEFTRDGRYALVSVWETEGALVVYDARTLEEVKRIPMKRPSGKYNVYNKIARSSGTSH